MKVKKDIYHILFFEIFFGIILIILGTIGFFLGFELSKKNILIYLFSIVLVIMVEMIIYIMYLLLCKTYYEFTNDSVILKKCDKKLKLIKYSQIRYCEYYKFSSLLLGNSNGGKLIVYFKENNVEKSIEISFPMKLIKRIPIGNIQIK